MFSRISEQTLLCLVEGAYITFMTTINRCIPVAIAIYRYCCVFYSTWLLSPFNRRSLERLIYIYLTVSPVVSTYLIMRDPYYLENRRYNICMGKEEAYLYKDLDFLNEKHLGPLSGISMKDPSRWIINLLYFTYIILVPYCYIKIFRFREVLIS